MNELIQITNLIQKSYGYCVYHAILKGKMLVAGSVGALLVILILLFISRYAKDETLFNRFLLILMLAILVCMFTIPYGILMLMDPDYFALTNMLGR